VPAGTRTTGGAVAQAVLLDVSVTSSPPTGALPEIVTVPIASAPPTSVVGVIVIAVSRGRGGFTMSVAVLTDVPSVAVIVTDVATVTAAVVNVKVLLLVPLRTVTGEGTGATVVLLLARVTSVFAVVMAESVTVPVTTPPPTTVEGLSVRLVIVSTARADTGNSRQSSTNRLPSRRKGIAVRDKETDLEAEA